MFTITKLTDPKSASLTPPSVGNFQDIAWVFGDYIFVLWSTGSYFISPDAGLTWKQLNPNGAFSEGDVYSICFNGSMCLVVTNTGALYYAPSPFSTSWTSLPFTADSTQTVWPLVTFIGGLFVTKMYGVTGGLTHLKTSPDGINWTTVLTNIHTYGFSNADWPQYASGEWWFTGATAGIFRSADLSIWQRAPFPAGTETGYEFYIASKPHQTTLIVDAYGADPYPGNTYRWNGAGWDALMPGGAAGTIWWNSVPNWAYQIVMGSSTSADDTLLVLEDGFGPAAGRGNLHYYDTRLHHFVDHLSDFSALDGEADYTATSGNRPGPIYPLPDGFLLTGRPPLTTDPPHGLYRFTYTPSGDVAGFSPAQFGTLLGTSGVIRDLIAQIEGFSPVTFGVLDGIQAVIGEISGFSPSLFGPLQGDASGVIDSMTGVPPVFGVMDGGASGQASGFKPFNSTPLGAAAVSEITTLGNVVKFGTLGSVADFSAEIAGFAPVQLGMPDGVVVAAVHSLGRPVKFGILQAGNQPC